jgi:formylglycine-generating enzyme required for sulfatase activity
MVELPAGEFLMGENDGDKFANDTERPAHRVRIANGFALGCFPVTVGEFRRFRPGFAPGEADALPVVRVNWHAARAYCDWLTKRTGRVYRLPAEAEWEYACRAGSRTPFACGHELTPAVANYFYDEYGMRVGVGQRTPAGSYAANAFGLYDLHGNVNEWMADTWQPDYHGAATNGSVRLDGDPARRVIRGGAWDYLPRLLRSAWRDWRPADQQADNLGFRVATSNLENPASA